MPPARTRATRDGDGGGDSTRRLTALNPPLATADKRVGGMLPLSLRLYVVAVSALAAVLLSALAVFDERDTFDRPWLAVVFASLIALEHLFETRLVHAGEEGESYSHEESFLVAMALLASPLSVALTFAVGFLVGSLILRRRPIKALFNVAAMVVAACGGLLVISALGGAETANPRTVLAVLAGAAAFVVLNRTLMAAVFALAGSVSFRAHFLDDLRALALSSSGNISVGLLAGLAASAYTWTFPFALAAMVALHFAFTGHVRALAERQKLTDLIDSSSDGILSVGRDGKVLSWNRASEEITGYPASRVIHRDLSEVSCLVEARSQTDAESVSELYPSHTKEPQLVRISSADGQTRWLSVSRAPLPEGGSVIVLRDETMRRKAEEMIAEQHKEKMRSEFVAAVSHELRTPLASILGFSKTLLTREHDESERRRYLQIVEREGERLKHLIDDLLDLRTIADARFTIERGRIDLIEVVAEQIDVFGGQSEAHAIVTELPVDAAWVEGDRERLAQVVGNLISNAIKYSPDGGEVTVSARPENAAMRVSVSDRGLGIPASDQPGIFKRFFRVEAAARRGIGGNGLGLALAREIVEAHGGRIGFESTEGEGSTFYFDLPLEESPLPRERA